MSTLPAVTETETQTETETATETETTVSTLDPVSASKASAGAASSAAAVKSSAAAAKAAASAAAAAKAGPIFYSMSCETGGDFKNFNTYKDAWKARPLTTDCDADTVGGGGVKHGAQFTALEAKALTLAYGKNPDKDSLSTLFGLCGGVNGSYTKNIVSVEQANEAAGALLICPDHPNAKAIRANIDTVNGLTGGDPNVSPADVVTYSVSGSASSASVTYSAGGTDIAQENDVSVPWSKTLTITGEYSFLSISAQNQGEGGDITCTITQGGKVIKTITSTGSYAIASCSG